MHCNDMATHTEDGPLRPPAQLVTVIIPAFNANDHVLQAIQSVLSQTHGELEVIVVDDASTDNTSSTASSAEDSRVVVVRNEQNLGPGPSRDRAIEIANGDWIAFLDADDVWHPERLRTMLEAAGEDGDIILFDDILLCHHTRAGLQPWKRLFGEMAFGSGGGAFVDVPSQRWASSKQFLLKPMIPRPWLRKSGIKHNKSVFQEDTDFLLRLIAGGLRLRYVPRPYYLYRITPGSLSSHSDPGGHTRNMIVNLLPLFADDPEMVDVLQFKVNYRDFTGAIKRGNIRRAARIALDHPAVLPELVVRLVDAASYRVHRALHRGQRR